MLTIASSPALDVAMKSSDLLLTRAVTDGDIAAVRSLLAAGADVNTTGSGQPPLILAVAFRRVDILKLLLEAGASPYLRNSLGMNAIDWANWKGFVEEHKLLTKHEAGEHQISTNIQQSDPTAEERSTSQRMGLGESREPKHDDRSQDKSQRWLSGFRKRIEEQQGLKGKEAQLPLSPGIEKTKSPEKETSPSSGQDRTAGQSTVSNSEGVSSSTASAPNLTTDIPQTDVQTGAEQSITSSPQPDAPAALQPPLSIFGLTTSPHPRRCPKCNALYNSDLLAYCAIDMTPLVDGNESPLPPPRTTDRTPLLWLLVAVAFVAAWGLTSLVISNLKSMQDVSVATPASQADSVNELPLVEGELSGKQTNLPTPAYPVLPQSEHVSGKVVVRVRVNKEGKVTSARVVNGDNRFRDAAIAAARKATFAPEKLAGKTAVGTISYTFK